MLDEAPTPTLIFDAECPLCQWLAEIVRRRSQHTLKVESWQLHHPDIPPQALCIDIDGKRLAGAAAWEALLALHPDLKSINWLAEKLGLQKITAKILNQTGYVARRLCYRCPRR